ncbi:Leucine-rich repeat protein soc-2-like protein [Dorcoceras hygrometricum]|uniref:Leucine-rich repeat protein soc-2-like protein n=1 Tax=Dorcoceras hygrometricum TaxID=472368 RepID=A0A2Z7AXR8_9LAMI|nr:Leucine-rich repeat protein soc-2-like protein [Dorcoceras hygrometricum]
MLTQKLTLAEERTHRLFSKASNSSNFAFPLPAQIQRLKWVANERAKQGESNATKISKNRDWMRWEIGGGNYGEQYIAVNDKVGVEEVADVPRVKKTPVKKAVSRKRPEAVDEPIVKNKRTRVGKAAVVATDSALEAVPVQAVAPISSVPPLAPKCKIQKRKRRLSLGSDDEIVGKPTTAAVEGEKTPVKKAVSRKRPAAVDEPIVKNKRTRVGKAAVVATDSALEAVPVQAVAPISSVPPLAPKRKIQKRKRRLALGSDDEIVGKPTTVAVEVAIHNIVEEQRVDMSVDPVDQIIEQVIAETAQVETDVGRTNDSGPNVEDQGVKTADETELWCSLSYEELAAREANRPVETTSDTEEEFVTEKELTQAHGLRWEKPCCSTVFEGPNRDRGAVIARSNTNIKSTCWIRTMLCINGTWVLEPCADYWKKIPRVVASSIVVIPFRLSYVDTLPPVSESFKLLKKWAIAVVQPVSVFGSQRPTVTSWGWSQLCTAFLRYSLFSGLSTVDIRNFVSILALNRSVLRDVQLVTHSVSVAPSVQTSIASVFAPDVQSITSSDSSANSSLRLNANDISMEDDAGLDQFILASSAADISASLAALRESFSKLIANQTRDSRKSGDSHSEVLCKINHVERVFLDSLVAQNEAFRGLFKSIRQEAPNDNNALSLALKAVRTQNAILSTDLAATKKEVKDLKVALSKDFDDKLADIRNDLLEFRVETQEQLALILLNSLPLSLKAVMTKRGKAVAAALNRFPMTKIDQVVEVIVEQMTQADMVETLSVEKVVTKVVMVEEEVTVVVLQREGVLTVVVDLVVV